MLAGLAHTMLRHRWKVIGVWILLTLFGVFAGSQVSKRWYQSFSIPGNSAYETNQKTLEVFNTGILTPVVVVFHDANGDVTTSAPVQAAMEKAAAQVPGSQDELRTSRPATARCSCRRTGTRRSR